MDSACLTSVLVGTQFLFYIEEKMVMLTRKLRKSQNLESKEDPGSTFIYQNFPWWGHGRGRGKTEKCPFKATLEKLGSFEMPTLQIIV